MEQRLRGSETRSRLAPPVQSIAFVRIDIRDALHILVLNAARRAKPVLREGKRRARKLLAPHHGEFSVIRESDEIFIIPAVAFSEPEDTEIHARPRDGSRKITFEPVAEGIAVMRSILRRKPRLRRERQVHHVEAEETGRPGFEHLFKIPELPVTGKRPAAGKRIHRDVISKSGSDHERAAKTQS